MTKDALNLDHGGLVEIELADFRKNQIKEFVQKAEASKMNLISIPGLIK